MPCQAEPGIAADTATNCRIVWSLVAPATPCHTVLPYRAAHHVHKYAVFVCAEPALPAVPCRRMGGGVLRSISCSCKWRSSMAWATSGACSLHGSHGALATNLKSKVNLRLASATWVLSSNSLVLAHTVKYYNKEATRFGLFTLHQASILCNQTEPTNTRHQCESNSRVQVFG
jgi:hypothetical protein